MTLRILCLFVASCVLLGRPLSAMTAATEHPGSVPVLLGLDKVRAELHLTSLQRAVLDSLRDEYKASARKIFEGPHSTAAERTAAENKLATLTAYYNNRAISVLNDKQEDRFREIERQVLGGIALFTPSLQKKLALTPAQLAAVEKIRQAGLLFVAKTNHEFEEGKIGYFDRESILHKRKVAVDLQLMKLLTPDQRAAFAALSGRPFSLKEV